VEELSEKVAALAQLELQARVASEVVSAWKLHNDKLLLYHCFYFGSRLILVRVKENCIYLIQSSF
jgi:hypothetical protein